VRLSFVWYSSAQAQLRHVDRETAMRILMALTRYSETGEGDVKALEGKFTQGLTGCVLATGECDSAERKAPSTFWRLRIAERRTDSRPPGGNVFKVLRKSR